MCLNSIPPISLLTVFNGYFALMMKLAPVVHIVGTPSRVTQETGVLMHHTLNDGNNEHFTRMQSPVTVAQVDLVDACTAAGLIDYALEQRLFFSRPVYISVPTDMVEARLKAPRLNVPLALRGHLSVEVNVKAVLDSILDVLQQSKRPFILVDGESRSCGVREEINRFVEASQFPTATTAYGKSLVDEGLDNYHGIYSGNLGKLSYKEYFDSADVIVWFGPHKTDTNTYSFTTIPDPAKTILFRPRAVQVGTRPGVAEVRDVSMKYILNELTRWIKVCPFPRWIPYLVPGSLRALVEALKPVKDHDRFDQGTFS